MPSHATLTLRTGCPEDTRLVAAALAVELVPGDVVALSGELGAGKTVFVQGAAAALGVTARVTSPTFVLVRTYGGGRLPLVHCDVYRLETLQDVLELGEDVLAPDAVTFVEWGDAITALLPDDRFEVELTLADVGDPDGERVVTVRACGRTAARLPLIATACAAGPPVPSTTSEPVMLVLGVETSTSRSSVALVDQQRVVASASLGVPRRHGEFLAPAIRFCCEQAGVGTDRITGVAVGLGPGLYTGLRVGVATAQAFAGARGLPVVGMSGLDVLAFRARYTRRMICATIDARRNELFWAFYRAAPGGVQRETDLTVGRPQALAAEIEAAGEEVLVVGDGALGHRDELDLVDVELAGPDVGWPDAADLAALAVPRFVREETKRPTDIRPIYLRQADARIGWEERGRLRGGEAAP